MLIASPQNFDEAADAASFVVIIVVGVAVFHGNKIPVITISPRVAVAVFIIGSCLDIQPFQLYVSDGSGAVQYVHGYGNRLNGSSST